MESTRHISLWFPTVHYAHARTLTRTPAHSHTHLQLPHLPFTLLPCGFFKLGVFSLQCYLCTGKGGTVVPCWFVISTWLPQLFLRHYLGQVVCLCFYFLFFWTVVLVLITFQVMKRFLTRGTSEGCKMQMDMCTCEILWLMVCVVRENRSD